MSLETIIRQAKPQYTHTDSDKMAAAVLDKLQEPAGTNHTGESSVNTSYAHKFRRRIKHWVRTISLITAAATVAGLCIVGSGFVSPVMANALSQLPIVGGLFEQKGDAGLRAATEQGLVKNVNASVTHEGVTFGISDLMYDGTRISMELTRETSDGKNPPLKKWWDKTSDENIAQIKKGEEGSGIIQIRANGERLDVTSHLASDILNHNSSILTIEPEIEFTGTTSFDLPDEFTLDVIIRDATIKRDFKLTFPVTKTTRNNIVLSSSEQKTHDHFSMNIKKVEITEATMQMEVNLSSKDGQNIKDIGDSLMYDIVNEQGVAATLLVGRSSRGTGDSSYLNTVMFEPFPTIPKSIVIKPYILKDNVNDKVYFPELEFKLPVHK